MTTIDPATLAALDQLDAQATGLMMTLAAKYDHLDEHEAVARLLVPCLTATAAMGPDAAFSLATGLASLAVRLHRTRKQCTCGGEGGS